MTAPVIAAAGVDAFVAALDDAGADPVVESGLVTYSITPVTGAMAGQVVRTGVILGEVLPWPTAPPHWIHLPAEVRFGASNIAESPRSGWVSHSRDIKAWGTARSPIAAWLAHVRGMLSAAT